jgi:hypothetical protein
LTERIARATHAEKVELGGRVQSLWGGYGELWRAQLLRGSEETSVLVKVVRPPRNDTSASHRRKLRSYEVERAFYARFAERCAEPPASVVPRPVALEQRDGGWLFVLEDLDASGFGGRQGHAQPPEVAATLRWLARFHARFLGTAPDGLWKVGTYWQLSTRAAELAQLRHQPLKAAAGRVDARLNAARFKTLVHGDAKLENVCFARDRDEVALVDFQYVGGGVGVKDVAYFLNGVVAPRACSTLVPRYLDDYFRELREALATLAPHTDAAALEREWRELFPLAWVDFYRFLLGWAPGQFDDDPYSEQLTREVSSTLTSA